MNVGKEIWFCTEDASGDIIERKGTIVAVQEDHVLLDIGQDHPFRIHKEQVR